MGSLISSVQFYLAHYWLVIAKQRIQERYSLYLAKPLKPKIRDCGD